MDTSNIPTPIALESTDGIKNAKMIPITATIIGFCERNQIIAMNVAQTITKNQIPK
jgi:hypothetical protein